MENKVFDMEKLLVERKNKTVIVLVGDVNLTQDASDPLKVTILYFQESLIALLDLINYPLW